MSSSTPLLDFWILGVAFLENSECNELLRFSNDCGLTSARGGRCLATGVFYLAPPAPPPTDGSNELNKAPSDTSRESAVVGMNIGGATCPFLPMMEILRFLRVLSTTLRLEACLESRVWAGDS